MLLLVRAGVNRDAVFERGLAWTYDVLRGLLSRVAREAGVEPGEHVVFRVARGGGEEVVRLEGSGAELREMVARVEGRLRIPPGAVVLVDAGSVGVALVLSRLHASVLGDLQVYAEGFSAPPSALAGILAGLDELVYKVHMVVVPAGEAMDPLHDMREARAAWWSSCAWLARHAAATAELTGADPLLVERVACLPGVVEAAGAEAGIVVRRAAGGLEALSSTSLAPLYQRLERLARGALGGVASPGSRRSTAGVHRV